MKLGYTLMYVADVLKTADFYQKAFGLKIRFLAENQLYVEMETGATALGFVSETFAEAEGAVFQRNRLENKAPGIEIAFSTEDVAKALEQAVTAGATLVAEPTQKPWGQTVAFVRDINGVLVELCTPIP